MTQPGSLDRRITIQQNTPAAVPGGTGEPIDNWADLATVWAEVIPVGGSETFQAKQTGAEAVAKFRIRYRGDVLRKMRVVYDSDNYDIADVQEDRRFERRQYEIITATARVG